MQSHNNVVKFIRTNLMKCNISGELILKHNPSTNTPNLCVYVSNPNPSALISAFWNHLTVESIAILMEPCTLQAKHAKKE